VVADRGQRRSVRRKRDARERRPLALEAVQELGGKVLRVGGRAAVAAGENLALRAQRLGHAYGRGGDRGGEEPVRVAKRLGVVGEVRMNAREERVGRGSGRAKREIGKRWAVIRTALRRR